MFEFAESEVSDLVHPRGNADGKPDVDTLSEAGTYVVGRLKMTFLVFLFSLYTEFLLIFV